MTTPRPTRSRFRQALVGLVAAGVLATGCSTIPVDGDAHGVDDVPEDFLAITTTSVIESIPEEVDPPFVLVLYFVNTDGLLVRVERPREEAPFLREAIDALTNPPTEQEREQHQQGITTALLPGLEPSAGQLSDSGVLPIQVSGEELRLLAGDAADSEKVRVIYSQMVCTLVAFNPRIRAVEISDAEGNIRVQGQDGAPIERPITPAEVNDCKTAEDIAAEFAAENEDETTSTSEG